MILRSLAIVICSSLMCLSSWMITPTALALTEIKLSDLTYQDCPEELTAGNVTSGGNSLPAKCYMITGKAENKSGKNVIDADVYGRIYDANNNPVMQNRTRVGSIDQIPPGVSDIEVRVTVPANQPEPLQLKQFKASGFSGKVRRYDQNW